MQEHIYTAKTKRILFQSLPIWFFVAMQIAGSIMFLIMQRGNFIAGLIVVNIVLSCINVPAIILFARFYRHSVGKKFIVMYNKLNYVDDKTGELTELINTEIVRVILVETQLNNRLPWNSHAFFKFIDSKGKEIIITSYFMGLGNFWTDTLARRVTVDQVEILKKTYPLF